MAKALSSNFFNRPTLVVAKNLLGKFLVRKFLRRSASSQRKSACHEVAVMITEVEAYDGPNDRASHASRGKTERTKIMFGEAGRFYVYFTYGMHWLVNIVTGPKGYPAAVLIRGAMLVNSKNGEPRPQSGRAASLSGPARLAKYLKIDKKFNGKSTSRRTGLWFEDRGVNPHTKRGALALARMINKTPRSSVGIKIKLSQILRSRRVGVDYAGKWAKKLYNFKIIP
jgi:DNA-3-methyladenine glycosylase